MNSAREAFETRARDERGVALVGVLLLLMMMTALGSALAVNGETETLIVRNQLAAAQAQAAAEAGLNHGVEVTTDYIFRWKANGFASVDAAVDAVLTNADAGNLNGLAVNTTLTISAGLNAQYLVNITDDDNLAAAGEDGDLLNDVNQVLVVISTGTAHDGTKVVLEALISPLPLPAVVTNGDLTISGNAKILGPAGSVHSNGNLTISGSSVDIAVNATSSGTLTCTGDTTCDTQVDGYAGGNATQLSVPPVSASDYRVWADFILASDGTMKHPLTGLTLCTWSAKTSCNNWDWNAGTGTWTLNSNTVVNGTYYVEGHANVSGSPGSVKNPAQISIIAEGSIDITGSPKFAPDTPELLFVTNQDLKLAGSLDVVGDSALVQGQMLVKGQIAISGNVSLEGQLIVENQNVGSLVTSNSFSGNAEITYTGTLGGATYAVSSWRDVRDAD